MKAWGKGLEKSERGVKKKREIIFILFPCLIWTAKNARKKTGKNFD